MKKILMGITALFLGIVFWAFTQPKDKQNWKPANNAIWYYWNGSTSPTLQSSYSPVPAPGEPDCDEADVLCAILAQPDGAFPAQIDVDAAKAASSNFTAEVEGLVEFKED
jgi:hypothetical protein